MFKQPKREWLKDKITKTMFVDTALYKAFEDYCDKNGLLRQHKISELIEKAIQDLLDTGKV